MDCKTLESLYAAGDRMADALLIAEIYAAAIDPDRTPDQARECIRDLVEARNAGKTRRMRALNFEMEVPGE